MKFHKSNGRLAAAVSLLAAFGLATLTGPQSGGLSSAQAAQGAPQIVSSSPARGATNVDPALILIRFQDETKGGKVRAWQDHAGLIHSL
jgi:hypothetical protein